MIYFDHNATTPIDPIVLEAMQPFLTSFYGNPSSLHRHGRLVKTAIDQARQQVAELVNVQADQVVFTSGGTEANNLAIFGACLPVEAGNVVMGATEHPSVRDAFNRLRTLGGAVVQLKTDNSGLLALACIETAITAETQFISVMHANNETGVIQPLAELAELCSAKGVTVHSDAVQSCGKVDVDFAALGVDFLSMSAHKIYGPKGVGALITKKSSQLTPMLYGGGQELACRPGTENVAGIVGFGKAAELAKQQLAERTQHLQALRAVLEDGLSEISSLQIVAKQSNKLPNTCQIVMDNMDGEMLLMELDRQSIAVSSGSACASNSKEPSRVLTAMGYPNKLAMSAIRISLGQQNTQEEISTFLTVLKGLVNR